MNGQEYLKDIMTDAIDWIDENYTYYDNFDEAFDEMSFEITGDANGGYYSNDGEAEVAVIDVIFDPEIQNLVFVSLEEKLPIDRGPKICDVYVRLALLNEVLYNDVLDYWDRMKNNI